MRGSSGGSEAWARAIRAPTAQNDPGSGWGGVDYDDLNICRPGLDMGGRDVYDTVR